MDGALSVGEIKARSVRGAKWLFVMNVLGVPVAYALVILLGRAGPEVLGAYGLAQIFVGVIVTFVVFGGQTVLSNFMPKVSDPAQRGRLFTSYSIMLVVLMIIALAVFRIRPQWFTFLLRRELDLRYYGFFAFFAVVVIANELLIGALSGLMHIKTVAITRVFHRFILLPFIAVAFFFFKGTLREHALEIVLGLLLFAYLAVIAVCIVQLRRDERFHLALGWHIPPGFMAFCWTTHMATLFTFITMYVDRMFALDLGDLAGLGRYQAVISVRQFIIYVPVILSPALVPTFSSLLAGGARDAIRKTFALVQKISVGVITVVSLLMVAFSRELLGVFGEGYSEYYHLLAFFSLAAVATSPFLGNTSVLASMERNRFRLLVSMGQVVIQLAGTILLIDRFGVFAIAGARMVAAVVGQIIVIYYVTRVLKMGFRLPREYAAGLVVSAAAVAARLVLLPPGWLWSSLLAAGSVVAFCLLARLSVADVLMIKNLLMSKKKVGKG